MRRFVAPGKVVLLGEYAVLDGSPALVAAVDAGVACTWTPGLRVQTTATVGDTRFVDAALVHARPGLYAFSEHNPPRTQSKPGLGGSAAATVVATFAVEAVSGRAPSRTDIFERAFAVHHAVQGSGSGIDVAASTWGGVCRFVRGETPVAVEAPEVVVVWSGVSAKTGPRVQGYLAWPDRAAFVRASQQAVEGFATEPVAAMEHGRQALEAMAEAAGLAYRTAALDRIGQLARAHGGSGKPSGAGGGDCAVAVLPDEGARASFVAACEAEGFDVLSTRTAPGVREVS